MEIMIDIETLGRTPGSIILEVGLVAFQEDCISASHQFSLDIEESEARGFTKDPETVAWWEGQGGIPPEVLENQTDVRRALTEVTRFVQFHRHTPPNITRIWTRGNFDLPLLDAYYREYGMQSPWKYYEHRELRTALDVLGAEVKPPYTEHRALRDAISQAYQLMKARSWANTERQLGAKLVNTKVPFKK